jgi:hypothetical protein
MTNERTDIDEIARAARGAGIGIIVKANDANVTLAFLDGLFITEPKILELLAEVRDLRLRGAPSSAYGSWHHDLCDVLRKLVQQSAEADAEAQRKDTVIPAALQALGYGNITT